MATKFDVELALSKLKSFLQSNLNTTLAAIDSEKNDGITLKTIGSSAYHLQYAGDGVELTDPFVIYEEAEEPVVESTGPQTAIRYHLGVWIVLSDQGIDPNIVKRLFRYRRALIDVIGANWDRIFSTDKCSIAASSPSPPFNLKDEYTGRAIGVVISFTIVG